MTDEEWDELTAFEPVHKKPLTARALLESGLVGLWQDRTGISDSVEHARFRRHPPALRWLTALENVKHCRAIPGLRIAQPDERQ